MCGNMAKNLTVVSYNNDSICIMRIIWLPNGFSAEPPYIARCQLV